MFLSFVAHRNAHGIVTWEEVQFYNTLHHIPQNSNGYFEYFALLCTKFLFCLNSPVFRAHFSPFKAHWHNTHTCRQRQGSFIDNTARNNVTHEAFFNLTKHRKKVKIHFTHTHTVNRLRANVWFQCSHARPAYVGRLIGVFTQQQQPTPHSNRAQVNPAGERQPSAAAATRATALLLHSADDG